MAACQLTDRHSPMKLTIERAALLRSLAHVQNVVERRTTIPILSNVKLAAEGDRLGLTATDMDLSLVAHEPAQVAAQGHHDGGRAHPVRHRAQAAGRQRGRHRAGRGRRRGHGARRPLRVQPAHPARRRVPGDRRGAAGRPLHDRRRRPHPADRQDPVRDLDRGDALLPQRHPHPRHQGRCRRDAARRRHRRPPAGPGRGAAAGGGRADPADHRPAQDGGRGPPADRQRRRRGRGRRLADPHPVRLRPRGAGLAPDRRHLPRLRARHPDRQREAGGPRPQGLRRRGRPRRHHLDREGPGGEAELRRRHA